MFTLNTYSHFSLSSKTWALRCLRCNVPGHGHVRQIRDAIQAQLKDEGMVLCDVSFERKKTLLANRNPDTQKKVKNLVIGVLPLLDALVG
jgi:hypothetical protein